MLKGYPRPMLERANWVNLNGPWQFAFDDENIGEANGYMNDAFPAGMEIQVPYAYECKMSGIDSQEIHNNVWYRREVEIDDLEGRWILRFEGVDYVAKVWVNGKFAGSHQGGYAAFSFDVTDFLTIGTNTITLKAEDSFKATQPRGKQRWKNSVYECWYIQTTGIWKTVWMEKVSPARVTYHKMTPDIDQGTIRFEVDVTDQALGKKLICQVSLKGQDIVAAEVELLENQTVYDLSLRSKEMPFTLKLWWPHDPVLYDVVLKIVDDQPGDKVLDEAKTYFGMRKIETAHGQVLLNNLPLYQRLILDQGYWKDSHLTPPSEEAMIKDIEIIKEAGYNGLRKHEKVEDPRFHYLCDKMGMLLWCEMPSTYVFNDDAISNFSREWVEIVRQNYNHPSIITWTVINESWGVPEIYTDRHQQLFTEGMYYLTKSIDPMRLVLVNEGWEHTISDIVGLHDYHEWGDYITETYADKEAIVTNKIPFNGGKYAMAKGYEYKGQPVMNTEYGGIAFADESGWGYGCQVASEEEFIKRFDSLTTAFKKLPYNMGYCFTQVTDVQQEINGLWDIDRNPKVDIEKIREINLRKV